MRRAALVDSLVDPSNGYSRLRLGEYGLGDRGWDALPERNFAVRPTTTADIGRFVGDPFARSDGAFAPVFDRESFTWTHDALLELGRRAFHEYPLSLDPVLHGCGIGLRAAGMGEADDALDDRQRIRHRLSDIVVVADDYIHPESDRKIHLFDAGNSIIDRDDQFRAFVICLLEQFFIRAVTMFKTVWDHE